MVAGSMTDTVELRHDWSLEEIQSLLDLPLMDLLWRAQGVHRAANPEKASYTCSESSTI